MQDLISRRMAIEAILHNKEVYSNNFGDDPIDKYTIAIIDNDAQTIAQLPSAQPARCIDCVNLSKTQLLIPQPERRWIPCDKGEPDEDMECWVTVKTTDTLYRGNFTKRYGERRDKGFITSGGFMYWDTALAWMPIYEPKPYKGKERL